MGWWVAVYNLLSVQYIQYMAVIYIIGRPETRSRSACHEDTADSSSLTDRTAVWRCFLEIGNR